MGKNFNYLLHICDLPYEKNWRYISFTQRNTSVSFEKLSVISDLAFIDDCHQRKQVIAGWFELFMADNTCKVQLIAKF